MIVEIIWGLFLVFFILSIIIVYLEVKKAPIVDSNIPFFHDDYDEDLDPTVKYKKVFCEHCLRRLDDHCNNGKYFGKIDDKMIERCKHEQFFEPK